MIEMIVADLDGTLLRSDRTISEYTVSVLSRCREKGIKIAFATARPLRAVKPYLGLVRCDALAYHNGAHVTAGGRIIGEPHTIPIETARSILASLKSVYPGKRLSLEIGDEMYANFDVVRVWNYTSFVKTDFFDLPRRDADKIIVEADEGVNSETIEPLLTDDMYCRLSEGAVYLIMNRNATKHGAVAALSRHWDISLENAAAFGDDNIDIGMIKECGIGVAMGNSIREVLDCADFIADTNDNDGVAKFIEENIL
jgi:5-amino-6-(5-phospho-D-ribitylamino)uracil phosphatase